MAAPPGNQRKAEDWAGGREGLTWVRSGGSGPRPALDGSPPLLTPHPHLTLSQSVSSPYHSTETKESTDTF